VTPHEVVERVVSDCLTDATAVWELDPTEVVVSVRTGDDLVCRASMWAGAGARDFVAHVANLVQDAAMERLGHQVPACDGHSHAAVPRATATGFAWVCPDTGTSVIGYDLPDEPIR
jgi:hypothetical protein